MRPAASRQSPAMTMLRVDRVSEPDPAGRLTCRPERTDNATSANATSRTRVRAAAAATTATAAKVAQSMCTDEPPRGQAAMLAVVGGGTSLTLSAFTTERREAT